MWLIAQIAIGILFGFILVINLDTIWSYTIRLFYIVLFAGLLSWIFFIVYQFSEAIRDYNNSGDMARMIFSIAEASAFLCLGFSTLISLWFFTMLCIPEKLMDHYNRSENSNLIPNFIALTVVVLVPYVTSFIPLRGIIGNWYNLWIDWSADHGMGDAAGLYLGLIIWQLMWVLNFGIFAFQKRSISGFMKLLKKTSM